MKLDRSSKKLKDNIIYSSVYQILVMIVPIITTPYVTRIFNVSQIGDYSLSITIVSMFVIISQFGIETYGSREISRSKTTHNRNGLFFELFSIQFIVSILMFVIYNFIFLYLLNIENKILYFIQSLLILVNIFDISWFFVGIEEIKRTIFRNTLTKVFTTISIFIFINEESHLNLYALINVIGMLIGNLTMIFASSQYIDISKKKFSISRKHIKSSFKLLIPKMLNSSHNTVEQSILRISTTSSSVGIYSEAKKINNILFSVINSAINALSPRMSYYVSNNDTEKIEAIFNKGLEYSNVFSIVFIGGIFAVVEDFVNFFYGSGFELVSVVLRVVSLSLIIIPIMALINRGILIPYDKDKEFSNSIIIILVSAVIFNLILTPQYGALGAGIAYNISQLFSFIYVLFIIRKLVNIRDVLRSILKSVICIIGNVFIVNQISKAIYIHNPFLSFLFFGMISVLISLVMVLILRYFDNENKTDKDMIFFR